MHDRLVPFERILNFRDFGGWETADGGKIERGKLFRSAAFNDASDQDVAKLEAMNVRFLVDLRRPEERRLEPNRWPADPLRVVLNDKGDANRLPPHLQVLMQSDLSAAAVTGYMRKLYREFAFDGRHMQLFRSWFQRLSEGGGPAIIHCAAGKDRTGLGCALTLIALGVDEESIFADYEFTNQAVDIERRLPEIQQRLEEGLGRKLDPAALRPMLGVHADYLRDALDAIDARYGSALNYLEQELGVGARERAALREQLST